VLGVSGAATGDPRLAELMAGSRAAVAARVRALAAATAHAALGGGDTLELLHEAHRIAGTAGMVGLDSVSSVARELEALLAAAPSDVARHGARLSAALLEAVAEEAEEPVTAHHDVPRGDTRPLVLVAIRDDALAVEIQSALQRRGARVALRSATRRGDPAVRRRHRPGRERRPAAGRGGGPRHPRR
jgi:HPt (histidine-containing phosphotransfer) domain-containing protein